MFQSIIVGQEAVAILQCDPEERGIVTTVMPQSERKCSNLKRISALLVSAAVIVLLTMPNVGCGRAVNRTAERHIRDMLPNIVGSARHYSVHVEGGPSGVAAGKLSSIAIEGDDVQLSNGLLIDHLQVTLKDVVADLDHKQLRRIGSATFSAVVGQTAVDEFLAGEEPEGETLRNVHVIFRHNSVILSGERVILGAGVPFKAYGPLKTVRPQGIEMDASRLVVMGIPISGQPLTFLKKRFESSVDLSTLPIPLQIDTVRTENKVLIVSGKPDIGALLQFRTGDTE